MGTERAGIGLQEVRHDVCPVPQGPTGAVQADDLVGNTVPNGIRWSDHISADLAFCLYKDFWRVACGRVADLTSLQYPLLSQRLIKAGGLNRVEGEVPLSALLFLWACEALLPSPAANSIHGSLPQ